MPLTRRDMLGLGMAAALAPFAQPAHASRFVNRAGLAAGQFVWEPSQPKSGPVVILVSRLEQLVHVYRNGAVVGISTCQVGSGWRTPMGVFSLNDQEAAGRSSVQKVAAKSGGMRELTWSATALHAVNLKVKSPECVRVPTDFARLLSAVADAGTLLIIADRHTRANTDVRTDRLLPIVPRPASTDGDEVALILSRADRSALLLRNGVIEARTRIRISEPRKPLGTHVYGMLGVDEVSGSPRWLGVGLGRSNNEPHLAKWRGGAVMERISFEDPAVAKAMSARLAPGSSLIITDAPAGATSRSKAPDLVVLAAQSATLEPQQRSAVKAPAARQKRSQWAGFLPTILP